MCIRDRCKVVPYSINERWARRWSRFLGSQHAGDSVINPAVCCHYFLPGPQLPSVPSRRASLPLTCTNLYHLVTEAKANRYKQLVQGRLKFHLIALLVSVCTFISVKLRYDPWSQSGRWAWEHRRHYTGYAGYTHTWRDAKHTLLLSRP